MKIVHLTSVHPRGDTRIYIKECCSLANAGYDVSLVVADDKDDDLSGEVKIYDVGKVKGGSRLKRIFKTPQKVYKKALVLDADVYHFHDPELIPIGIKLKKKGKKVIYDVHEDVENQILSKEWIPKIFRKIISFSFWQYEKKVSKKFNYIAAATPFIRDKFLRINKKTVNINNYPLLEEFDFLSEIFWDKKDNKVCYIGGISKIRGVDCFVESLKYTLDDLSLSLVGSFENKKLFTSIRNKNTWNKVDYLGFLDRKGVVEVLKLSKAGLVTFLNEPNHINAQPNKIFEYMSATIPVIASDFPLWKQIVEGNKCGICVNPLNPKAIAEAINYIIKNPKEAEEMGQNGRKAVEEKYNWAIEERKLLGMYKNLQNK